MSARPSAAFTRLLALVAIVFLLTSRVMLLVHEFGGHGAPAALFGGRVTGWYLFLFAGGRVSYEIPDLDLGPRLVISLGGIALELVFGVVALRMAHRMRPRPALAFGLLCAGTVVLGHGAVYLARGVHYGFGDGALLARLLGNARPPFVLVASALAVAAPLLAGRHLAGLPAALLTGPPWRVAGATLLVFAGAGVVHGGLAWVEVTRFPDPAWVAIMEDASVASARAEVRRQVADAERRGEPAPSPADQRRMLEALERARRPWPLDPVLALAAVAGLILGMFRGARERRRTGTGVKAAEPPSWRAIGGLGGALVVLLGIILVLRRFGAVD